MGEPLSARLRAFLESQPEAIELMFYRLPEMQAFLAEVEALEAALTATPADSGRLLAALKAMREDAASLAVLTSQTQGGLEAWQSMIEERRRSLVAALEAVEAARRKDGAGDAPGQSCGAAQTVNAVPGNGGVPASTPPASPYPSSYLAALEKIAKSCPDCGGKGWTNQTPHGASGLPPHAHEECMRCWPAWSVFASHPGAGRGWVSPDLAREAMEALAAVSRDARDDYSEDWTISGTTLNMAETVLARLRAALVEEGGRG